MRCAPIVPKALATKSVLILALERLHYRVHANRTLIMVVSIGHKCASLLRCTCRNLSQRFTELVDCLQSVVQLGLHVGQNLVV